MNYPNGIIKQTSHNKITYDSNLSHKNRGMTLEYELNQSNEYYREIDKAYIYKKPTPIKIVKVDYPSRDKAVIKEAYFTVPSTTDYNGLYNGKYIDFEAKETKASSFPLSNIHKHQIEHLKKVLEHGGISFLIIRFTLKGDTYLLPTKKLLDFIESNKRQSIPYEYFKKEGFIIKDNYNPRIDYLSIIEGEIEWKRM